MRHVRLATFNVFSGRSLRDGAVDADRLRAAAAQLDADVVGLQEVDRAQPRSGGLDLAAEVAAALGAPAQGWRFAPALLGTPGGSWQPAEGDLDDSGAVVAAYGVALVSRLPVSSWHVVRLPASPLPAPVLVPSAEARGRVRPVLLPDEPRVVLAAVLELPGSGTMTVAATHLSFVPGWNVVQLRRVVAALRRLPQPVVLLGDLNMPWPLPLLGARGWRPLARRATWPAPRPRVQLDHILATGTLPDVVRAEALELPVSDHRALIVDLADPT